MAKLSAVVASATQRAVVYGEPKSGKTEMAGQLSAKFNLLWFDLEKGYSTLLKLPKEQQEKIELIAIPDSKAFPIAIETMLKVFTMKPVDICEEHGKVGCALCKKDSKPFVRVDLSTVPNDTVVVIDSLTQLSNSAMSFITRGKEDTYKSEWDDYRAQGALLDRLLSAIQQSNFNVVCLTHVVETEQEDGKKKLVPMCGTTAFSRNVAKYFDHVVYLELKNRKHIAGSSTGYSMQALTGSRTDMELEGSDTLLDIFLGNKHKPNTAVTVTSTGNSTVQSDAAAKLAAMRAKVQGGK